MKKRRKCIVDTNVAVTANESSNLSKNSIELTDCIYSCIIEIERVINHSIIVLDSANEILDEYRRNLNLSGQPGVGDRFFKWLFNNQGNINKVEKISITRTENSYSEFPDHNDLSDFDSDDRKFVAVANAHPEKPPILEATDTEWWKCRNAFSEVGITIEFLCKEFMIHKCS